MQLFLMKRHIERISAAHSRGGNALAVASDKTVRPLYGFFHRPERYGKPLG